MSNVNNFLLRLETQQYFKTSVLKLKDLLTEQTDSNPPMFFKDLTPEQQNWFRNYLFNEKNLKNTSYGIAREYWEDPKKYNNEIKRVWSAMLKAGIAKQEDGITDTTGVRDSTSTEFDRTGYESDQPGYIPVGSGDEGNTWRSLVTLLEYTGWALFIGSLLWLATKVKGLLPAQLRAKLGDVVTKYSLKVLGAPFSITKALYGLIAKYPRNITLNKLLNKLESGQLIARSELSGDILKNEALMQAHAALEKIVNLYLKNPMITSTFTKAATDGLVKLFVNGKISKETLKSVINDGRTAAIWKQIEPKIEKAFKDTMKKPNGKNFWKDAI